MSTYQKIIPVVNQILQKYDLCDYCLGRLFSKQLHLSSNKLLGKKLKKTFDCSDKCYICKNLFDHLEYFLKLMHDSSSSYSFTSFSIGAIIKPSIVDRDDLIRSQFQLKGIDSIKTGITKELSKLFSKRTKKSIDPLDSDVTFTLNFKNESCELRSKFIIISGRYVKTVRGFSQKQKSCENCSGKGCRICNFHGITDYDSVEGVISKLIFKKFGGTTIKFTWIGGEDKSSLVLGKGRPFFAKIQCPYKRKTKLPDVEIDSIKLCDLQLIRESPKKLHKFHSTVVLKIISDSQPPLPLKKLKDLDNASVVVYDKSGKRTEKRLSHIRYKKNSKNTFILQIVAEGGLPIKRFVSGDDVTPSISQLLETNCTCSEFDFLDIEVQ